MAGTVLKGSRGVGAGRLRDEAIVRSLARWFERSARDLPWRRTVDGKRDPWAALVSEVMLQQTQVSRVVERFGTFLERFPSAESLAAADESEVLALWSGMGYYRRAMNLHAAARAIVEHHGGGVPQQVELLRTLPGVGRYTAGAIASIVYGKAEPTVDGNIARVLLRIEGKQLTQEEGVRWAWGRAEVLVRAARAAGMSAGALNEGLMELGAVVCIPRGARCDECPLREACRARRRGIQEQIPVPKARPARRILCCTAAIIEDSRQRILVEQRSASGMWAGLWQAVTFEGDEPFEGSAIERLLGVRGLVPLESFTHATTHRDVRFCVWGRTGLSSAQARRAAARRMGAVWMTRDEVLARGISNAQKRIMQMRLR